MSFSASVKREICTTPTRRECCVKAELAGFVRLSGTIEITSGMRMLVRLDTESEAAALHAMALTRRLFGETMELSLHQGRRLRRQDLYSVRVTDEDISRKMLEMSGILSPDEEDGGAIGALCARDCCKRAFLRGAFLASGTITDPEKEYHAEIVLRDEAMAERMQQLTADLGLSMRVSKRATEWTLYLKDADSISDFLQIVGAHGALLEMENVRVLKSVRNQVNRTVNCETGNLKKVMTAAQTQIDYIRRLEAAGGFPRLSLPLRQAAELRLEYEEASLQELSDLCPGVSRTAMNKRLRRVVEIAKKTLEGRE